VQEIYGLNPKLDNRHGGVVLIGDYLYGDSDDRGNPFCAELMTGDIKWKGRGPGNGSTVVVGGGEMLFLQFQDGEIALVQADPSKYTVVSHFKIPGSGKRPSWAHPSIADGKLYVRSQDQIFCYDITTPTVASVTGPPETPENSFVKSHGQLAVQGTKLVDAQGQPVVLRGVSYGWSNWWSQFYNAGSVRWLANDWKCTVVRAAMGVGPQGSYLDKPDWSKKLICDVADAAIANGIYVIIDWHDHNAHERTEESIAFFKEMATRYGDKPNVIYEIYNEPVDASWPEVKQYSQKVIEAIRSIDPDNIILVGTPHWDQDIHLAADDPISGQKNIMYSLHFYADTHKQWLRDRADQALRKGLPLFVSEYGGCAADGNGPLNQQEWDAWIAWTEKHQISSVVWSISSKEETCSMLPDGATADGNWPPESLKPSGAYARNLIRGLNSSQTASSKDLQRSRNFKSGHDMLLNGNFKSGDDHWVIEQQNGAKAKFGIVEEGPNNEPALRIEVLETADEPWRLQLFQRGLQIEKGKPYVLTFWVKSSRNGMLKAICMQDHEPWEHSTEKEVSVSSKWMKVEFPFDGPWDDESARITFTNLGTEVGQVYWIANGSLIQKSNDSL
jgi:endoglucanase